jgi:hypothetical protein
LPLHFCLKVTGGVTGSKALNQHLIILLPHDHAISAFVSCNRSIQRGSAMQAALRAPSSALSAPHCRFRDGHPTAASAAPPLTPAVQRSAVHLQQKHRSVVSAAPHSHRSAQLCRAASVPAAEPASAPVDAADTSLGSAAWRQFAETVSGMQSLAILLVPAMRETEQQSDALLQEGWFSPVLVSNVRMNWRRYDTCSSMSYTVLPALGSPSPTW